MKRILILLSGALLLASCGTKSASNAENVPFATGSEVIRIEPLSWWTDMKTDLQLMVKGDNISEYEVSFDTPAIKVKGTHPGDNPNYVFIDVEIGPKAVPGTYYLVFKKGEDTFKAPYVINGRREGSADRESFTTADLIYLIMPDRFANGDPANDNAFSGNVYDDGSARAYKVPTMPDRADREKPLYRHGGDLKGIIDHLDYIADLGATALWSTPLLLDNQEYESYHGYACCDYYHIDPRFGDNALYREMVSKAHDKGIKVIMDVVTNHCGTRHWWMDDAPFKDWYHVNEPYMQMNALFSVYMDPNAAKTDLDRQESGWFVPSMPDMNLDNPFVLKYFQQWAIWWIEYADLDGLRVDTYPYNEPEPMSRWCAAVREEYPAMNIVGECWDNNIAQLAYWQTGAGNKNGFDSNLPSIMDFPLRDAMIGAMCEENVNWSEGMTRVYSVLAQDFAYADLSHMMTFFANHDHPRTGDIMNRDPRKMKMLYAMLATIRGIPQLYYGDEMMFLEREGFGNDGSKRIDFPGGWEGDKYDLFTAEGREAAGLSFAELHDYAKALFNWRKTAKVIHDGKTLHFLSRHNEYNRNITENTYGYFRYNDTDAVYVFINNESVDKNIPWSHYSEFVSGPVKGRDVVTGSAIVLSDDTVVPAKSALVVEFKR